MAPSFNLEIIGSRARMPITAIVDTGFDGAVCLPTPLAVRLGLELIGQTEVELADGTTKSELVFAGSVHLLGRTREASVYLTNSEDALLGTALLTDCRLTIDFPMDTVRLVRKAPRREKLPPAS
jgi:clan AA aspartic protease